MRKLFLLAVILGSCGLFETPAQKACTKLVTLCGEDASEASQCASDIEAFDKKNNTNTAQKFADCTTTATTCTEAVGCAAGAGASSFIDLGGQFLKGFNKSLGQ
jgi:hypothetical protein